MQGLWSLLTNPNVIYILLIVGLWAATAALYVPGTGLLEVAAAMCLALPTKRPGRSFGDLPGLCHPKRPVT